MRIWIGALCALVITGCLSVKSFSPTAAPIAAKVAGLPSARVTVAVSDLRTDKPAKNDSLAVVVQRQFTEALAASPSAGPRDHTLQIDVLEHRVSKPSVTWHASTRFRARLVRPDGTSSGDVLGQGSADAIDLWSDRTARPLSQRAYAAAVADLLSALGSLKVP